MLTLRARIACVAAALGVAATVSACGSGGTKEADEKTSTATPSSVESTEAPQTYLPVADGVTLTDPGTALAFGDEGVIAFRVDQNGDPVVLGVTVDRVERTSFDASFPGWTIDPNTAARTPYFVRLTVTNLGERDPGGRGLDSVLWADDGTTLEAPNAYTADQLAACPDGLLPTEFPTDAVAQLCQVYFIAPDRELTAISFVPPDGLDAIRWTGDLSPVSKPGKVRRTPAPSEAASPSTGGTPSASATSTPSGSPSEDAS